MASSPLIALVLEGYKAIETLRQINGKTNPLEAENGSIRADYCLSFARNMVHASDSSAAAKREISIWFNDNEIFSYDEKLGESHFLFE